MEKKIIFTPVEPNRNLLWLHYREDHLVLERFGSNGWESVGDTDHITEEELIEALKNKADLVGGKVPAEQLPSYVDDVIEFNSTQLPETQISVIVGNSSYKNKTVFVNGSTNISDRIGSQDKYPNMFVNFGENTSESDWVAYLPEKGKIYINTNNNHSYRWTGTQLLDLDKQFSDEIAALNNKTYSILYGSVTDRQDLTTGNPGQAVLRVVYETLANNTVYALMSIRFSNNGVSYTLPLFDVNPSEHSFRIYNNGALQKYQVTLSGSTYAITLVTNINPSQAFDYESYSYAGGTKAKAEVYSEMAAAFTANWITVESTSLGTTITDAAAQTKLENASAIVITYPDESPLILTRGEKLPDRVNFLGISNASEGNHIVYRVVYMITTHALSVRDTVYSYDSYTYYKNAGGTKTKEEFDTKLVQLIDA